MLDTNTVSHFLRRHPAVVQHVVSLRIEALCISAIIEDEILFGLAKVGQAARLQRSADEFHRRVDVIPWGSDAAAQHGALRATMERSGRNLSTMDMLIAAHALSVDAVLVTNDRAFAHAPGLAVEDWLAVPS